MLGEETAPDWSAWPWPAGVRLKVTLLVTQTDEAAVRTVVGDYPLAKLWLAAAGAEVVAEAPPQE